MKYSHLFLKNPTGIKNYVSTTRVIEKTDDEEEELIKKDYTYQKEKLKSNLDFFMRDRIERKKNRTLDLPFHFEYIEIHFFVQFNKDFGDTKDYYQKLFGLQPVSYRDFNKTVLFYIENTRLFQKFIDLVEMFFNSTADEIPEDQDYHAITLIYSFDFLSSSKINEIRGDKIILTLTERIKNAYGWEVIKANLFRYIESREGKVLELTDGIWELSNMINYIHEITNNFDIIQKAQSIPPIRVTPSSFNLTRFSWGFETIPNESLPIVGVIDSGIDKNVEPLKPLLVGEESILDRPKGISSSHGTNVASLIAFGKNLITPETPKEPVANLYSIQVLCEEEGNFSYNELKNAIINAHKKYNIRIFNLSVCDPIGFEYNASLSKYAMMLDELAYKYDLLIFIATGNLNEDYRDYIVNEVGRGTHLINYPNHFYNAINHDYSQPTNLGSPSESMNNITVGAIACNNFDNKTDLTDYHTLPAYYTRKYYVDYSQKINGSKFNKNQMNKNIFKPDILMPGGDWSDLDSKMIVLGRGHVPKDYYNRLSGTSLATPLAANIAAKVLFKYPILNMQSVKALLINSSITTNIEGLITNIIEQCKETEAQKVHGCSFSRLSQGEKMNLSTMYNSRRFSKYIEGHGVVNEDNCLNSNEKRVTFVIEDSIKFKQHKVQHIKIPDYLLKSSKNDTLRINATLCFKFSPVKSDQIGYNPIHISYNFIKAQNDCQESAETIANQKNENEQKLFSEDLKRLLGIHAKMGAWSEDFGYLNRKIFSNTQNMSEKISKKELVKVNNEIAIVIRCVGKETYWDPNIENPFSLVITIEENENLGLNKYNLYDEICAINNVEGIMTINTELDIEIED